ncbi:MAG: extracellular solute-binding protein [Oscillospiraceae bacterium]|nr:extracellular solute-binding protein [Oscillospiraceae bacterium]
MNIHINIKKFYYIIFIIAILLIAALCLFSCGNDGESVNNDGNNAADGEGNNANKGQEEYGNAAPAEDLAGKDELPEKNFNGKEFVILVNPDPAFRHFYDVCVEGMNGDLVNDAVYKRNLEVEERFNVKITDRQTANIINSIKNNVAAGTVDFSAAWVIIRDYGNLSQQNMFLDLNKVPDLNLEKKYWDTNVVRDFTINNKLYGIMGDISTSVSVFTHLFGVNKIVAQNNDVDISGLYQSVRDGTWTFDKLYSVARDLYRDLDGDGSRNFADQYGFSVSPAVCDAMFSASGEKLVTRDNNGDFVLTSVTERIESVYSKITEIIGDKTATIATWNIGTVGGVMRSSAYEYVYYDKFISNTVLFTDIDVGIVMDYRHLMEDDFGIVPIPKFSESQPNYSVYAYPFYPMLTIPSSYAGDNEFIDFAGTIMEGLASASYRILTPAFYDTAFATKFTRDEESIEMLDIVLRSRIYDWMNIFDFGRISSGIWSAVEKDNLNIVSLFEKNEERAKTDIQKLIDAYAEND